MLKNYFAVAFRTIFRNRIFSTINVIGLAIGISVSLIIFLYTRYELSYDNFHNDGDRIYRVVSKFKFSGEQFYNSGVVMPAGSEIEKSVSGLEVIVPFWALNSDTRMRIAESEDSYKNQRNIIYAPPSYFNLFSYRWITGSAATSLSHPYAAVLTRSKATQLFADLPAASITGKKLVINDSIEVTITGIVDDFPSNTDFSFNTFISWSTLALKRMQPAEFNDWTSTTSASQLLVKLNKNTDARATEQQLLQMLKKHNEDARKKPGSAMLLLQPIGDIHFDGNYGTYFDNRLANKPTLYSLLVVAAFILLLACINFINLSTAQSSQRAREIGIRKTIGGSKKDLVTQFLIETLVLTLIATAFSVLITPLLIQSLREFIPQQIDDGIFSQPVVFLFLSGLIVSVTLLAGFYPAWVLSAYRPVEVLKGGPVRASHSSSGLTFRRTLTVSQFVISQVFIIAVVAMTTQLRFSVDKDPGFRKNGIVYFQTSFYDTSTIKRERLVEQMASIPGISMISRSNNPVAATGAWTSTIKFKGKNDTQETSVHMKMGDTNYIKLFELKLLAGRNVRQSDSIAEFIINETYLKTLGFSSPREAVGSFIEWNDRRIPIVGVVSDFHQQSLHQPIKPLVIGCQPSSHLTINFSMQPFGETRADWNKAIASVERFYKQIYPDYDFEYSFQDETIRGYYENEIKTSFILKCATAITIIISCLGLLGLTIYSVSKRTKEIGIRKVLGASVLQIVNLVSKEALVLIVIGFVIAAPLAYWGIVVWLENFAYRAPVTPWLFIVTFIGQAVIAMATVGSQAIRAASVNPVKSLKTE